MNKTVRRMRHWVWHVMAVFGVLATVSVSLMSVNDIASPKAVVEETYYPSPDGKYIAQRTVRYRLRLLSPYCYEEVQIYPASFGYPEKGTRQGAVVYGSTCASTWSIPSPLVLKWRGNREIALGYLKSTEQSIGKRGESMDPVRLDAIFSW